MKDINLTFPAALAIVLALVILYAGPVFAGLRDLALEPAEVDAMADALPAAKRIAFRAVAGKAHLESVEAQLTRACDEVRPVLQYLTPKQRAALLSAVLPACREAKAAGIAAREAETEAKRKAEFAVPSKPSTPK